MRSIQGHLTTVLILTGVVLQNEATIRVLSIFDDETVYLIKEKPILTNTDVPSKGMLMVAKPSNACQPIVPAPPIPINVTLGNSGGNSSQMSNGDDEFSWVLLVSWKSPDECTMKTKAEHAYAAGYSVIVFEDPSPLVDLEQETLSPLLTPVVNSPPYEYGWTDANVYAYTIEPRDWRTLKNNFTSEQYYLAFEDSNSMSNWFTYFLLGILIIGAVFFTIGLSYVLVQLLVLILIWIRESIVSRIQQVRRDRRRRLPASQLKKIPIQQWNTDMLQDICSICLETFVESDRVRILPCSHVFHQACIDPWLLKQRRKCPNCKRKIVFPDENRDSDSSSDDERTPLIRGSSSTRESFNSSSPQHSRHTSQRMPEEPETQVYRNVPENGRFTTATGEDGQQNSHNGQPGNHSLPSSINIAAESAPPSGIECNTGVSSTSGQPDLKGKVEQLCARMENVGRKIRKKVKSNQASKLDDSSSDMSTGIQPLLVSVSVEPNNNPDSDCDKEFQVDEESQSEEQPSSSNATRFSDRSRNQESSSSQLSPELEVKVVPANFTPSVNNTNITSPESTDEPRRDSSILSDLNA